MKAAAGTISGGNGGSFGGAGGRIAENGIVTSAKNSGFSRCPAPLSNSASH